MEPTYYDLLGTPHDADRATIAQAYLARLAAAAADPTLDAAALVHAYGVLTSSGQRAAYDFALCRAAEERDGYDAIYEVVVSPEEAQLGTTRTLSFHRADGQPDDVIMLIPPGTVDGTTFRHPGKGGPSRDGRYCGNLIVVVRIR